jgi:hypothetical protein
VFDTDVSHTRNNKCSARIQVPGLLSNDCFWNMTVTADRGNLYTGLVGT